MTKIKKETPNTKHQKITHIRCLKCQNIWLEWTIQSQIWKHTDRNCKIFMIFFPISLSSLISLSNLFLYFSQKMILSSLNLSSFLLSSSLLFLSSSQPHCATDLSLEVGFFFFFFFVIWYVGSIMGGFRWWCVGLDGVGWVWLWQWWVGSDGRIGGGWVRL